MSNPITIERLIADNKPIQLVITLDTMEWISLLSSVEGTLNAVSKDKSQRVTPTEIAAARALALCNQKIHAQVMPELQRAHQ